MNKGESDMTGETKDDNVILSKSKTMQFSKDLDELFQIMNINILQGAAVFCNVLSNRQAHYMIKNKDTDPWVFEGIINMFKNSQQETIKFCEEILDESEK